MTEGYRIHLSTPEERERVLKTLLLAGFQYRSSEGLTSDYRVIEKPYFYIYTNNRKYLTFGSVESQFRHHYTTRLATIKDLQRTLRSLYNFNGAIATHVDNEGFQWAIYGNSTQVFHPQEDLWIDTVIDHELITLTPI